MLFSKGVPGPPVHHLHLGGHLVGGAAEHVQGAVVGFISLGLVNLESFLFSGKSDLQILIVICNFHAHVSPSGPTASIFYGI